jgi:hypothetical protein
MPNPINRPSLTTNLEERYSTESVGGAFDVQKVLGPPGSTPPVGSIINANSIQGKLFQSPSGFEVKITQGVSQFIEVQDNGTDGLSQFVQGLSTVKYNP